MSKLAKVILFVMYATLVVCLIVIFGPAISIKALCYGVIALVGAFGLALLIIGIHKMFPPPG